MRNLLKINNRVLLNEKNRIKQESKQHTNNRNKNQTNNELTKSIRAAQKKTEAKINMQLFKEKQKVIN